MLDRVPILPVRLSFVAVGLGLLLAPGPLFSQGAVRNEAFPLEIGNSWTYTGTVWWMPSNSRRILKEQVDLKIEVVDVIERRGVRAVILRGLPNDLVVLGRGRAPAEYLLVQMGEDRLYLMSGQRIREALPRLRDPEDPLVSLVQDSELVLDLPLFAGKTFCAAGNPAPDRRRPCWSVREQGPVVLAAVRGLSGARQRERYTLDLQWEGDHIVWGFVPGVGLTSYAIGHSGAASAVELVLVEAHLSGEDEVPFLKTLDLAEGNGRRGDVPIRLTSSSPILGGQGELASAPAIESARVPGSSAAAASLGSGPVRDESPELEPPRDADGDGVVDPRDACDETPAGAPVNSSGCPIPQDADGDGVVDPRDVCPETAVGGEVNSSGCPLPQDADGDGVVDPRDVCPDTPSGASVNASGCPLPQDADGDGVMDPGDACPHTPPGAAVNAFGCPIPEDADGDGVVDPRDVCPDTPSGAPVDSLGCPPPPPETISEEPAEMASQDPVEDPAVAMEPPPPSGEDSAVVPGRRPCADDRDWFGSEGPIEFDGRRFEPDGEPEPIGVENLVVVGEHDGVLLFAGRILQEPYTELWLPVCTPAGSYHLYAEVGRSD